MWVSKRTSQLAALAILFSATTQSLRAEIPPAPALSDLTFSTNGQKSLEWAPYPAAQAYRLLSTRDLNLPMSPDTNGTITGFTWVSTDTKPVSFYQLEITPLSSNALLTANVLNRMAYGPTPDELERILTGTNAIGPQAYIEEQLALESIEDDIDTRITGTNWTYATDTGIITGTNFIIYLSGAGQVRIDDLFLVEGDVPEAGPNLLVNGGFEIPTLDPWIATSNYAGSFIDSSRSHSGNHCLVLRGTARGSTSANGFYQPLFNITRNSQNYTLSYWYLPEEDNAERALVVRLSGPGAKTEVPIRPFPSPANIYPRLNDRTARIADLRAWFVMHAIRSKRQLTEILLQFLENHFVTQHDKTYEYFDRYYDGAVNRDRIATYLEYREISRWRDALLQPQATFHDLLKISAESPAMIIYLDTVNSRGDGNRIANENYPRELLELFCNGVDNGYDQSDIVEISKAFTGWTVDIKDEADIDNPLAPRSITLIDTNNINVRSNLLGVWTFHYRPERHHTNSKTIFPGRTVDARFGAPWAGRNYELILPARNGPESLRDGYEVLDRLANLPYTMEYISVKLCRLFIHDDFVHGTYDYTDPNRSPEADLVHQCMTAWESGNPKGQIRDILAAIFASDLFRSHGGSMQKIKTPLEYVASAVRALRANDGAGGFTAFTDGYSLSGTGRTTSTVPLVRMGSMFLFDRAEPDGYPEAGPGWISAGTLAERVRFVQSLCILRGQSGHNGGQGGLGNDAGNFTQVDPVALLKQKLPQSQWTTAEIVTGFFSDFLYPGEGRGNLNQALSAAVDFLNSDDSGQVASPFADLDVASETYDTRVRGMVAFLMSLPRFQEQ